MRSDRFLVIRIILSVFACVVHLAVLVGFFIMGGLMIVGLLSSNEFESVKDFIFFIAIAMLVVTIITFRIIYKICKPLLQGLLAKKGNSYTQYDVENYWTNKENNSVSNQDYSNCNNQNNYNNQNDYSNMR